jgi:hypothetical protein
MLIIAFAKLANMRPALPMAFLMFLPTRLRMAIFRDMVTSPIFSRFVMSLSSRLCVWKSCIAIDT